MKFVYIIGIVIVMLLISGCKVGEVVDVESDNSTIIEESNDKSGGEEKELSTKELVEKLTKEAGLDAEETGDEGKNVKEESNSSSSGKTRTITIVNFKATPEDLDIDVGTTVIFANEHENFKHIIGVRKEDDDGTYPINPIEGYHSLIYGESYNYTFNDAGTYEWLSKTKYPDVSGEIEVS